MLKSGQMTAFAEKCDQIEVKLSLELNVIETIRFYLQKRGFNKIELGMIRGPNGI